MATKQNKLSTAVSIRCVDRIRTLKQDIEAGKFTIESLADSLSKEIGAIVRPASVQTLLGIVEISMPIKTRQGQHTQNFYRRTEEAISALEARIRTLESANYEAGRTISDMNARLLGIENQLK